MVSVLLVGTPPKPANVYVGTFNTPDTNVEDPEEPVVVNVIAEGMSLVKAIVPVALGKLYCLLAVIVGKNILPTNPLPKSAI
jgi:hypothetical protein